MATLNRRDFLKALGMTSAGALSACRLDDNRYLTPIENVLPYVVRPEQITPGTPTFFATSASHGIHAYPIVAHHRDGRVVNVGANTNFPWPNAIPKFAFFELQRHYSPDRYTAPFAGESPITWEEGLKQFASSIQKAKSSGKKVCYVGPYRSGSFSKLIHSFADEAIFWEPVGYEAEAKASKLLWGKSILPRYDLSRAEYIVSLGASFLSHWGGTALEAQYAAARDPNDGTIARFAWVSPHLGQTGANADDWYAIRPGSELSVALALAKLVAAKLNYRDNEVILSIAKKGNVKTAAKVSGLSELQLDAMASYLATTTSVILPGEVGCSEATQVALVTYAINLMTKGAGKTFFPLQGYEGSIHSYKDIENLLSSAKSGKIGVLLLDDVNLVYHLPSDTKVTESLEQIDTIVAFSGHPDETNVLADIHLPTSSTFEDWGDISLGNGVRLLQQPAMTPLHDTRSFGDILLAVGRSLNLASGEESAFTSETWKDYIQSYWKTIYTSIEGQKSPFSKWWTTALQQGGWITHQVVDQSSWYVLQPVVLQEQVTLKQEAGDIFLHIYPHPSRYDGRYANQPWAQEIADPMTGQVWDSWVEVHPATAEKLGLKDNSLLTVESSAGKISIGVEKYKGIREDTIAIALGQGHTHNGRYADGVGVNIVQLLKTQMDSQGAFTWQTSKVTLQAAQSQANLVSTFGGDDDSGRYFSVTVPAEKLAKVGDKPSDHPGELTGIHHLARDERLEKAKELDFYPPPDHPVYRFAMTIDTNACNGCGVCAVACYSENNLPVVGKRLVKMGREMNWLRVNRYWHDHEEGPDVRFVPMMCQQCTHAPCENVCPVLATYHTLDGLNAMVYNRCVGTRYCANNCPYNARRFNFHSYRWPEPFNLQLNPDVVVRTMGVMEKCTFCVQRIRRVKSSYRDQDFTATVPNEALEYLPACAEACPTQAITFGNLNDKDSIPAKSRKSARTYTILEELNTKPAINYLARATYKTVSHGHGESHGKSGHKKAESHDDTHGTSGH